MRARLRGAAPSSAIAAAGIALMAWLGLYGFAWTDYDFEAAPAFAALTHGHLTRFLQLLPAYGGSLELRAPFALLPGLFGGGELAVYRLVAIPCLLAGAVLGVWLVARMRTAGHSRLSRAVALGLCVANPITIRTLEIGHPEELLGAVLCVAAVLLAAGRRPLWAGLLLGLAIANKQWALLAVGPVLLAFPPTLPRPAAAVARTAGDRPRLAAMVVAATVAAVFFLPILGVHAGAQSPARLAVTQTGVLFHPEQVFWFAGQTGHVVRTEFGVLLPGYRTPPAWLGGLAHPLIVALALPLGLLAWRRRRPDRHLEDALLLLALLFLLRCALDPWDNVYYPFPFLIALLAWEALTRRRPPVLALAASGAAWGMFVWLAHHAAADLRSAIFLALVLPATAGLACAVYGRPGSAPHPARRHRDRRAKPVARALPGPADPQPAIRSSLVKRLSASAPSAVTTTRSSMRTPRRPGR
ncbi:MAG: alpha,6-mannosyltransferase [Solirubrobacteraceae bacterium]|nr:alpha,6-mannosyltransferase [Solirubrobacteraceae bacterium]